VKQTVDIRPCLILLCVYRVYETFVLFGGVARCILAFVNLNRQ